MKKQPDLNHIQRWMMAVITHPDGVYEGADADEARRWIDCGAGQLESIVTRSRQLSASERLAIYGNAYYARLLECLGEVYPVLKRTLGAEIFDGFAFSYLQEYPSRSYTLHKLGEQFVSFLDDSRPTVEADGGVEWGAFLMDLARLEWAIYDVFDGPGMESSHPLLLEDLDSREGPWLERSFVTAPCLQLLRFDFPVNDFFTRVRASDDELDLSFPDSGRFYLALSRRNFVVRRYPLNRAQYLMLVGMQAGLGLGDVLEGTLEALGDSADQFDLEESIPLWFRDWAAERCFFERPDSR